MIGEAEPPDDLDDGQLRWRYRVHEGRVWFDDEVRLLHARLRQHIRPTSARGACSAW